MDLSDDEDFSAYVAARWPALIRIAVHMGCSAQDAEDLVQASLLRCYRSWSRIRGAHRTDAYVHRVVVNTYSKGRRRRWHSEIPTSDPTSSASISSPPTSDARADLRAVLAALTVEHRTVLVLRFIADLTEQQTADVLGIAVGTVKSRVSRALAAIDRSMLMEESP